MLKGKKFDAFTLLRPDVAFAASRRLWLCVGTYYMLRRDVILWNSITIIPPFARY